MILSAILSVLGLARVQFDNREVCRAKENVLLVSVIFLYFVPNFVCRLNFLILFYFLIKGKLRFHETFFSRFSCQDTQNNVKRLEK